jgi:hypothetical protein
MVLPEQGFIDCSYLVGELDFNMLLFTALNENPE